MPTPLIPLLPRKIAFALRELAADGPLALRITGDCMTPLLRSGAEIQVIRQRFYWPGDTLVLHATDGRLLAHRLIGGYPRARRLRWLTQADRATTPDPAVTTEQIIGKVCGGCCDPRLVRVPWRHRLTALHRFFRFAGQRLKTAASGVPTRLRAGVYGR